MRSYSYLILSLLVAATSVTSCKKQSGTESADAAGKAGENASLQESPLAGCTNLSDEQSITLYRALRETHAYSEPRTDSEQLDFTVDEGSILHETEVASIVDVDDKWMCHCWRDEDSYFLKSDFEVISYTGTGNFLCSFVKEHSPMFFVSDDNEVYTFFVLNKNGNLLEMNDEIDNQDSECIFMLQDAPDDYVVLQDHDGCVQLSNPLIQITVNGGFSASDNPVHHQRLLQDAVTSFFYDPDFNSSFLFVPEIQAIVNEGGRVFRYLDLEPERLDLAAFGLKGNVKALHENACGDFWLNYYFDPNGKLIEVTDSSNNEYLISREVVRETAADANNPLVYVLNIDSDEAVTTGSYYVSLDSKRLTHSYETDGGVACMAVYNYDEKGFLQNVTMQYADHEEGEAEPETKKYTYVKIDEQGNWLLRQFGEAKIERKVEYYQ